MQLPMFFDELVRMTNDSGLTRYSLSATHRICLNGIEHGLGIYACLTLIFNVYPIRVTVKWFKRTFTFRATHFFLLKNIFCTTHSLLHLQPFCPVHIHKVYVFGIRLCLPTQSGVMHNMSGHQLSQYYCPHSF